MSPAGLVLREILGRVVRRVRTDGLVAAALAVAALVSVAMLVAWAVGGWGLKGPGPLAVWLVGGGIGLVALSLMGRRWVVIDPAIVAAAAERARGLPEGSLRGVVELGDGLPAGVSEALFRRSESDVADRVTGASPRELAGDLGERARRRRNRLLATTSGLFLLTALVGFAAPDRARGAWVPLLHPVEHLRGPVYPPLAVTPGDTAVARGAALDVGVRAELRSRVTLHWRSVGDVPRSRSVGIEAGRGRASLGPIASVVSYWVEAPDGAVSDTFRATPRDPLMVTELVVDVEYPRHVGRSADHYQGDAPLLRVPDGTRIVVSGEANRALARVGLSRSGEDERGAVVDGSSFRLQWTLSPAASGSWQWSLVDASGAEAPGMASLDIEVVEDAPPVVRVTLPGADTLMPRSLRQPVMAEAVDDYGVRSAALVYRRVDARGTRGAPVTAALPVSASAERVSLRGVLDATDQPLIPGDAIEYRVEVRDNGPAGQVGRSATYELRLPSMSELRERAGREAGDVLEETRRLADRARDLESRTRDLSRSAASRGNAGRSGGDPGEGQPPERLGFEEASEARDVVADHEDVLSQVSELQARMAELERAIEEAGLRDPELQRRLSELRELYAELATPELQEQIRSLSEAVDELDPEAVRDALERLAERQEEFRDQIERTLEMMRRAAAEQELNARAREAEEIAARQEALAEAFREESASEESGAEGTEAEEMDADPPGSNETEVGAGQEPEAGERTEPGSEPAAGAEDPAGAQPEDSGQPSSSSPESRAEQQEELEERAEQLNQSLQALQQQLMQLGEEESSSQTGAAQEKGKASQQSMQEASEQARQQQGSQAAESGQRAAQQMSDAARTLDEARKQMSDARRREAQESVQQATEEALGMAQRQEALRQEMEEAARQGGAQGQQMQDMRSEQAALQQGLEQLSRNLSETGQRSAMIDQQVRRSLEQAAMNMDQTLDGLQEGGLPVRQAERSVESLNQLAMSLLENDANMQRAQAPGGMQQALAQLSQLAQEQGSLNGRLGALAPMQLAEQALTRQLQDIARQQRGMAGRIGNVSRMLGGREDVLGRLDQLSSEAMEIARDLEGGRLDPEVMARQERLFHRLLDAGRSLEREEYSDERAGGRADVAETRSPDALDPALLESGLRYAPPTAEQLDRLPPAYRRLILDYFERLNAEPSEASERDPSEPSGGGR